MSDLIPKTLALATGITRIEATEPVSWTVVDQPAEFDLAERTPTKFSFFAKTPFMILAVAQAGGAPGLCRLQKAKAQTGWSLPDFSWLRKLVPSTTALTYAGVAIGGAGLLALILWLAGLIKPTPPGPPNPDPVPVAGLPDTVIAVTDNDARTPELAAILMDQSLYAWLADNHVKARVVDVHSKEYAAGRYAKDLADAKLTAPAGLKYKDGKFLGAITATSLPTTDAVEKWIQNKTTLDDPVQWDAKTSELVFHEGGEKRHLTRLSPGMRMLARDKTPLRFADVKALIPRSQWRDIDRRKLFPASEWILDQDGIGSCVGNGSTAALRKTRRLAGMQDWKLSPGCTYAQINGGRDQGAVIGDSMTALTQTGTCLYSTLGEKPFYLSQLPSNWKAEAARFKIDEVYVTPTFDEMGTALQLGYVIVYGMMVGNNFERFTSEGVAGISGGPGNHCMHADGMKKLASGAWAFDNANSWGATWGPTGNGRCFLAEGHFSGADTSDAYAIKAAILDPAEKPPVAVPPVVKPFAPVTYTAPATTIFSSPCPGGVCPVPARAFRR